MKTVDRQLTHQVLDTQLYVISSDSQLSCAEAQPLHVLMVKNQHRETTRRLRSQHVLSLGTDEVKPTTRVAAASTIIACVSIAATDAHLYRISISQHNVGRR